MEHLDEAELASFGQPGSDQWTGANFMCVYV